VILAVGIVQQSEVESIRHRIAASMVEREHRGSGTLKFPAVTSAVNARHASSAELRRYGFDCGATVQTSGKPSFSAFFPSWPSI
jgi:hypothetical protein